MPYKVQGKPVSLEHEPQFKTGQSFVPLRELVGPLGGHVEWDNTAKVATATIGRWVATVISGNTQVDVSGTPVTLATAPYLEEEMLWVPADFFRAAFGYQVAVDTTSRTVSITNPAA